MAPVIHTPVEGFTGVVVGINFHDGVGETNNAAALEYFERAGYKVDFGETGPVPPAGAPLTPDELARVAASEAAGDQGGTPASAAQPEPLQGPPVPPVQAETPQGAPAEPESTGAPKRPYPQANKAEWFDYLGKVKPGHGLTVEDSTKAQIIAAVDAQ